MFWRKISPFLHIKVCSLQDYFHSSFNIWKKVIMPLSDLNLFPLEPILFAKAIEMLQPVPVLMTHNVYAVGTARLPTVPRTTFQTHGFETCTSFQVMCVAVIHSAWTHVGLSVCVKKRGRLAEEHSPGITFGYGTNSVLPLWNREVCWASELTKISFCLLLQRTYL